MKSTEKKRVLNAIYSAINKTKVTGRMYSDEFWHGVTEVRMVIEEALEKMSAKVGVNLSCSLSVENGGYRVSKDGMSHWKEYLVRIESGEDVVLNGAMNCHAAGSVENPFGKYDISLVLG